MDLSTLVQQITVQPGKPDQVLQQLQAMARETVIAEAAAIAAFDGARRLADQVEELLTEARQSVAAVTNEADSLRGEMSRGKQAVLAAETRMREAGRVRVAVGNQMGTADTEYRVARSDEMTAGQDLRALQKVLGEQEHRLREISDPLSGSLVLAQRRVKELQEIVASLRGVQEPKAEALQALREFLARAG